MYPGSFRSSGVREMGLDVGPPGIGEVGLVCSSSHARYFTELPSRDTFSDSFIAAFYEVHTRRSHATFA